MAICAIISPHMASLSTPLATEFNFEKQLYCFIFTK